MPTVRCELRDYQPGNPWGIANGRRDVSFSLREILHAASTVGHPDWITVLGGGSVPAIAELVWKTSICIMTLQADPGMWWHRPFYRVTDRFLGLDPSEKRGATYQLGLTLTKAYARRYLGVRWLMHLDVYWNRLSPVLQPGLSRPDLVGVDAYGNWVVFESKGRVSTPGTRARAKAKGQAGRVISVNGTTPALRASVFSYFRTIRYTGRGCLHLLSEDPPPEERPPSDRDAPEPLELQITIQELIKEYYKPLLPLMERAAAASRSDLLPCRPPQHC
jgi:hypothetical protein